MTQHFQVLLEWDPEDSVWVSHVPALNALSTFGDTREEALANTREAIQGYVEAAAKEGIALPSERQVELLDLEVAVA
ncbi:MAG TPA: type II toxin-antitoxin system HicB family antitoxin [Thermoanaerobaculia bacterium]|jgi:predicted RNase H-like HicB family nuclease